MGRFDGFLICTDWDGTFATATTESHLHPDNLEALHYFMSEGGRFTVATGRWTDYMDQFYPLGLEVNTDLICVNGTVIFDPTAKRVIYRNDFPKSAIPATDPAYLAADHQLLFGDPEAFPDIDSTDMDRICKVVLAYRDEATCLQSKQELIERYGDRFHFERSWSVGLELLNKSAGKADAIAQLKKRANGAIHTVIAVGDYENDIGMIRAADIGYAVGNALPVVKEAADRITVSNDEGALAAIVADLERDTAKGSDFSARSEKVAPTT